MANANTNTMQEGREDPHKARPAETTGVLPRTHPTHLLFP